MVGSATAAAARALPPAGGLPSPPAPQSAPPTLWCTALNLGRQGRRSGALITPPRPAARPRALAHRHGCVGLVLLPLRGWVGRVGERRVIAVGRRSRGSAPALGATNRLGLGLVCRQREQQQEWPAIARWQRRQVSHTPPPLCSGFYSPATAPPRSQAHEAGQGVAHCRPSAPPHGGRLGCGALALPHAAAPPPAGGGAAAHWASAGSAAAAATRSHGGAACLRAGAAAAAAPRGSCAARGGRRAACHRGGRGACARARGGGNC